MNENDIRTFVSWSAGYSRARTIKYYATTRYIQIYIVDESSNILYLAIKNKIVFVQSLVFV